MNRNLVRAVILGGPTLLVAAVMVQPFVNPKLLFKDPLSAADRVVDCCSLYLGFMSTLGVLLWTSTAAVCLFAAYFLYLTRAQKDVVLFAIAGGLLSAWLGFDDQFQVHERVAPRFGIPEIASYILYGLLVVAYFVRFSREVLRADIVLLILAGVFFSTSIVLDVLLEDGAPVVLSLEDGAKFIGIAAWAGFHIGAMMRELSLTVGIGVGPFHIEY